MIATDTLPRRAVPVAALVWPLTVLASSAAAFAIVHYRSQPVRAAAVLPVVVRLGARADLNAAMLQLNLSLSDNQPLGVLVAESGQQLTTALAALTADWEPATAQWHLFLTPESADAPPTWDCTVTPLNGPRLLPSPADPPPPTTCGRYTSNWPPPGKSR